MFVFGKLELIIISPKATQKGTAYVYAITFEALILFAANWIKKKVKAVAIVAK